MTALVIHSKHTCPYSKVYIGKEIKVEKCKYIKDCYKYKEVLFHKSELIF